VGVEDPKDMLENARRFTQKGGDGVLASLQRGRVLFGGDVLEYVILEEGVELAAIGGTAVGLHDSDLLPAKKAWLASSSFGCSELSFPGSKLAMTRLRRAVGAAVPYKVPFGGILSELVLFLLIEIKDILCDSKHLVDALEYCLTRCIIGEIQQEESYRSTDLE
jgi:hypothetical protein